jgi:hypothetical protein
MTRKDTASLTTGPSLPWRRYSRAREGRLPLLANRSTTAAAQPQAGSLLEPVKVGGAKSAACAHATDQSKCRVTDTFLHFWMGTIDRVGRRR